MGMFIIITDLLLNYHHIKYLQETSLSMPVNNAERVQVVKSLAS